MKKKSDIKEALKSWQLACRGNGADRDEERRDPFSEMGPR